MTTVKCLQALWGWGVALIVFGADQVSKWFVIKQFFDSSKPIVVTSFFNLVITWNSGVSFGLFPANSDYGIVFLSLVAITLSGVIIRWMYQAQSCLLICSYGLILGGAMGNLMDRFRFGAVADFLDFHLWNYHWYTFNIADSAIVLGVFVILLTQKPWQPDKNFK